MSQRESQPKVVSIAVAAARRGMTPAAAQAGRQPLFSIDEYAPLENAAAGDGALACTFERLRQHGQLDATGQTTLHLAIPERHAVLAAHPAPAAGSRPLQALFQALETHRSSAR